MHSPSINHLTINSWFSLLGAFAGWFWGEMNGLLNVLLIFIAIDYLTGSLYAISQKQLSSEIGFQGLTRKLLILILIGCANLLDVYLLQHGSSLKNATICFYLSNEGLSLLENTAKLGLPLPSKLKAVLLQLKEQPTFKEDKK
ncbi:phage holin family protein [Liquorilactobacillus vini]|uniref:Toxin secretion phage lysis holin n=1 Tax=Liquorilactobacillus vini DSM 20605 TaxID=1133569 RepID=A0A0R2CAQ5_9LACO|nr:phage holin family protein [Liquorilactobacillus vini]KRM88458.1 toxin secretion phage lysis holin [Liquorilactobacillus vini DSM 20605]